MDAEYVARHEKFVSNLDGTTFWEIQLVTSIGPLSILLRNLAVPWLFPVKNFSTGSSIDKICKLLLDFLFTILPTLLALTILSERIASLVVLLVISCIALAFFCLCEYFYLRRDRPKWKDVWLNSLVPSTPRPHFITYFRAYILIATAISILAVDFPCFPRRFAKTETWGYGFMDIGVGIIVVVNGIVAPEVHSGNARHLFRSLPRRLMNSWPLFAMGFARLLAVKSTGYQVHVTEYGVHWNFFFTLAAVKVFISVIACFVSLNRCSGVMAVILIVTYEYSLKVLGLEHLLLRSTSVVDRNSDLFNANREGIVSLGGYLTLYLVGLKIGYVLLKPRRRLKDWLALLAQLISCSFLSYLALTLSEVYVGEPSRRLANMTYCIWMIFLSFSHLTSFLAVELLAYFGAAVKLPIYVAVQEQHGPFEIVEPCLWRAINRRALFYFLLANILTGAVNFIVQTIDADHIECIAIMSLYCFVLSTYVFVQYAKTSIGNFYIALLRYCEFGMDAYEEDLKTRWDDLTGWIVDDVKARWWVRIKSAYTEPHRHYHTLKHLCQMFKFYDIYKDNLKNRYACAYAIFFHDLVYDPTKSEENEQKSAAEFNKFCKETTFDDASYVTNLIETTSSHCTEAHMQPNDFGSDDIHFLLDFDMAILGSSQEDYAVYKNLIRQEYSHLSDESYNAERAKVLRLFLQIPNIFATKIFRELYEQNARTNIDREIKELTG